MFKFIVCSLLLLGIQNSFAKTLATVGNQEITEKEFNKSYAIALKNGASLNRLPTKAEHLEDMIRFKTGLLEAKKTNLSNHPQVKKALQLELYKGLLEVRLAKAVDKIKVKDSEMKSYYKKNPFIRSSHIFIRLPKNPNSKQIAEAKRRADKIYKDVSTQKKRWNVYVRTYTDDTDTKTLGGDLGYHGAETLSPNYYKNLKSLSMNQVSPPIRGPFGFHIIKRTGILSYDRADKNIIKVVVFNKKRYAIFDKFFGKLKSKHKVTSNKDLL